MSRSHAARLWVLALTGTVVAGTLVPASERLLRSRASRREGPLRDALIAGPDRQMPPGEMTDSATLRVTGRLSVLQPPLGQRRALVLFLRARDCLTCEDLGRQLREVQHATRPRPFPLVLVTPAGEAREVQNYLAAQKVDVVATIAADPDTALANRRPVPTPAMVLIDAAGVVLSGTAHTRRLANLRLNSFAAELGLASVR